MGTSKLARTVLFGATVVAAGALALVGLLTGACNMSRPSGHCWRPGTCYDADADGSPVYECSEGETFSEHECDTALRIGACVTPGHVEARPIYLYAPLHGLLPPNCERIAGPGTVFRRN